MTDPFINAGVLGVCVLALAIVVRHLFTNYVTMLRDELVDCRGQNREMRETLLRTIPMLEQSNEIHKLRQVADTKTQEALRHNDEVLKDVVEVLRDVRRNLS